MSNYFTIQNTSGYSIAELAELNVRFNSKIAEIDADNKSATDHLAETILANFDDELALKVAVYAHVARAWNAWTEAEQYRSHGGAL